MSPIELSASELFDTVSDPVLLLRDGLVCYCNPAALTRIPRLRLDAPLPEPLSTILPDVGQRGVSFFQLDGTPYRLRLSQTRQGLLLYLQHDVPEAPLRVDRLTLRIRQETTGLAAALQCLDPARQEAERARQYLSVANQRLYRLLRLCDHLEFLERTDDELFRPAPVDLAGLLGDLCAQVEDVCRLAGQRFQYEIEPPALDTVADAALVRRLVLSLVSNAMKAAGEGGTVTLKLAKKRTRVVLTVSDTGPGMEGRDLGRLFGGESTAPPGRTPAEGLGLGLDAVRRIASLHGGMVMVESRPGDGLRAVVSLPIRPPEDGMGLRTPARDYTGGFSPLLVELSDALPAHLFRPEDLE